MPRPPRLQGRRHRFSLRAAGPEDVRVAMGKTEVIRSLETGDCREAVRPGHARDRRFETRRRAATNRDET